jgi:hydrogenase-4 component B
LANELLALAALLWVAAGIVALIRGTAAAAPLALVLGALAALVACVATLPGGTPSVELPGRMLGEAPTFRLAPEALWLMGFGLVPAILACWLATPDRAGRASWCFGVAASLLGALGVFGLQHGGFFLLAWELMSLGGAVMILGERRAAAPGMPVLFMLGLLEVGAVALLLAILLLSVPAQRFNFGDFFTGAVSIPPWLQGVIGLLLLIGFGAKLGLLPFYEWFPGAYGAGSGASGAILSGVILNAAFFGLSRGLLSWLPAAQTGGLYWLGALVVAIGVLSAILTVLYAFQQEDWRGLLSFSSAENASIAVTTLGAAMLFRGSGLADLAGLAWTVSLMHLAGHALAKGALFLAADGVLQVSGTYAIGHALVPRRGTWVFGGGALFAAMSLAAMPPQAGFVSEWYVFQTVFQGFHLPNLGGRLTLALAGAGLALTAAVAFATFIKVLGIGLLGGGTRVTRPPPVRHSIAVGILGAAVLALAVGMPVWLSALTVAAAARVGSTAPASMHDGLLLVPLTAKFAFISPSMLVIVMPLLALVPVGLLLASRGYRTRRVAVWYGGSRPDPRRTATTALTFSNALRTFYSFIYRPRIETKRESRGREYFVTRLAFTHEVAPVFGPYLFAPSVRFVRRLAERLRALQSGHLNFYLALIGALLVVILAVTLLSAGG